MKRTLLISLVAVAAFTLLSYFVQHDLPQCAEPCQWPEAYTDYVRGCICPPR